MAREDGDIYLAGMLAIKVYVNFLKDPKMAFCELFNDLKNHNGLERPGRSLLALVASRLAFHSNIGSKTMTCDIKIPMTVSVS